MQQKQEVEFRNWYRGLGQSRKSLTVIAAQGGLNQRVVVGSQMAENTRYKKLVFVEKVQSKNELAFSDI